MRALNEIGAMVQKAALGAGIPLGQAEDLGRVAIYLAGTQGDLATINLALREKMVPLDLKWSHDLITINAGPVALVGPVIRDAFAMGVERAMLADIKHVPLVAAMLTRAGFKVTIKDRTLFRNSATVTKAPIGPVDVPGPIWQMWHALAVKTYIPDSTTSRVAGAGAGLTDND